MEFLLEIAKSFGYTFIKPMQERVLNFILKGEDMFAILPTGYGKTFFYMSLPFAFDAITQTGLVKEGSRSIVVIVSPLKQDEVKICHYLVTAKVAFLGFIWQ